MPKLLFFKKREYSDHKKDLYARFLSERIYGAMTILAVNVGLLLDLQSTNVTKASIVIISTTLGLWLASMFAEEISHKVIHGEIMSRQEFKKMFISHIGIISAGVPSLIMMFLAFIGFLTIRTAIQIDVVITSATLLLYILRSFNVKGYGRVTSLLSILVQILVAGLIILIKLKAH